MLRQFHTDPVTGDSLSPLEYATRQVQVCLRTPWFMVGYTLFTLLCAVLHWWDVWNLLSSGLAIVIEWLVGTYMFGQTGRDAQYIRRIAVLEEINKRQLAHLETLVDHANQTCDATGPVTARP